MYREVVERRAHIVTGKKPTEAEIDNMIDTGESETIFQKAILEQGRGHVSPFYHCFALVTMIEYSFWGRCSVRLAHVCLALTVLPLCSA